MSIYQNLLEKKDSIAVVGLGYVGMPLAVAFAHKARVIGFDLNAKKIAQYQSGLDPTGEVGDAAVKETSVVFTADENQLDGAKFFVVAVPTPINMDKTPDLTPVEGASAIVGRHLSPGSIVVFESTVYPGVTEDICAPILERESGLTCGVDFKIGYSPERINPGDKVHRLETITKIVSGMDAESLDEIAKIYEMIIDAGVFRAGTIKAAEAAKVAENSQRDINIAFINELAMVFDRMGIDTQQVIEAMNTKWNALGFTPGLVGGHCIGVDPYYFVYQAENLGYHSQIILAGRRVNDGMSEFVTQAIIKQLALAGRLVSKAKVAILGVTFKENCPDTRNSKVADIVHGLEEYGIQPLVVDPTADAEEVAHEYGITLTPLSQIQDVDCLVMAVSHQEFVDMPQEQLLALFHDGANDQKTIIDVKGMLDMQALQDAGYRYWRM